MTTPEPWRDDLERAVKNLQATVRSGRAGSAKRQEYLDDPIQDQLESAWQAILDRAQAEGNAALAEQAATNLTNLKATAAAMKASLLEGNKAAHGAVKAIIVAKEELEG